MAWWKFWLASRRAKAGIEVIARRYCATAKAFRWGGSRLGQPSFCVEVATDQQRDLLVQESSLYQQFQDALYGAGYPSSVVPRIHFRVESRETLDRKYGGSWTEAMEIRPVVISDLYGILANAVSVIVKDSPKGDATTLFESKNRKDLEDLQESLLLETPTEWFHCMCDGSPALYLYKRNGEFVELTNHHGLSVRCSLWSGDVRVSNTEKWLSWFDQRGMTSPRQEVEAVRAQEEKGKRDWDGWLAAMPKAIVPVWSGAQGQFGEVNVAPLRAALERDVPNDKERILVLLEWFGSGAGPWSGFPSYEAAAEELLLGYPTKSIVEAIQASPIRAAHAEGAARLFGGWSFGQQRPGGLKEVPDSLKRVLWNHVKDTKDRDKLKRAAKSFAE